MLCTLACCHYKYSDFWIIKFGNFIAKHLFFLLKVIYNNKLKRTIVSLTIYTSFNINVDYMQVILNYLAFLLIFFSLQIFLFRFLRININKPSIIFFFIIISVIIGFYSFSIELVLNLIIINTQHQQRIYGS